MRKRFVVLILLVIPFMASIATADGGKPEKCTEFHFLYTDGHRDDGTWCGKGMDVTKGLHVNRLHISCSDDFPGGYSNGKSDLAGHQVASWSIIKYKDGEEKGRCGGSLPTPTATSPPPSATPTATSPVQTPTPTKPPRRDTPTPTPWLPRKTPTPTTSFTPTETASPTETIEPTLACPATATPACSIYVACQSCPESTPSEAQATQEWLQVTLAAVEIRNIEAETELFLAEKAQLEVELLEQGGFPSEWWSIAAVLLAMGVGIPTLALLISRLRRRESKNSPLKEQ